MPQVIVVAGPSGSGKSRLCRRLGQASGLPTVNLDDFYRDGTDPSLPRFANGGVDWDDPTSWLHQEAVAAIIELCEHGRADLPVYEIAGNARTGTRRLDLGDTPLFIAEGIFAHEIVEDCRAQGLVADAVCVHNHPVVTFWRRLTRDLKERRKPPLVLVRRGWLLMRQEPAIVSRAVAAGCVALTPAQAYQRLRTVARTPA